MKIFLLLVGLIFSPGVKELNTEDGGLIKYYDTECYGSDGTNCDIVVEKYPKVIDVKEFSVDPFNSSSNLFTSTYFSVSKTKFNKNTYYILTSRRNDDVDIFQTIFLDSNSFENISNMRDEEEIVVCVYYYKEESGFRENINLTPDEIKNEVIYIDKVRNQKYYYDYCGTNMFIKKTNEGSLLLLINNSYQTPKNWYELNSGFIEIKNENRDNLNSLISK